MKIIELDFGMGNIRSLQKAFEHLGYSVEVVSKYHKYLSEADVLLLPGDGSFPQAMKEIKLRGFFDLIQEFYDKGKIIFGVCIGFQILFQSSSEFVHTNGFGFVESKLIKFESNKLPVPHMGWNKTIWNKNSILGKGLQDPFFYYVHSYYVPSKSTSCQTSYCEYEMPFVSSVEKDNLFGVQFHPEKSHTMGIRVIKNFLDHITSSKIK